MKLFLSSEGKHPKTIEKLTQYIPDIEGKRIVYIPTAANGDYYGSWKGGDSVKTVQSLGACVDIVELENNSYTSILKQIGKPDILWMAGGQAGYLLYWIRRVKLDVYLPEILHSGTVYVGSSAGSMICAKTQFSSEWFLKEPEPGASAYSGLGLVDFEIYPHFEEREFPEIEKRWKSGKLCLLKDGDVIIKENDEVRVLGEEKCIEK